VDGGGAPRSFWGSRGSRMACASDGVAAATVVLVGLVAVFGRRARTRAIDSSAPVVARFLLAFGLQCASQSDPFAFERLQGTARLHDRGVSASSGISGRRGVREEGRASTGTLHVFVQGRHCSWGWGVVFIVIASGPRRVLGGCSGRRRRGAGSGRGAGFARCLHEVRYLSRFCPVAENRIKFTRRSCWSRLRLLLGAEGVGPSEWPRRRALVLGSSRHSSQQSVSFSSSAQSGARRRVYRCGGVDV
jgi:hypothetical protein